MKQAMKNSPNRMNAERHQIKRKHAQEKLESDRRESLFLSVFIWWTKYLLSRFLGQFVIWDSIFYSYYYDSSKNFQVVVQ